MLARIGAGLHGWFFCKVLLLVINQEKNVDSKQVKHFVLYIHTVYFKQFATGGMFVLVWSDSRDIKYTH